MSHVSQLIVLKYQQAHTLLYEELMFKAKNLIPMQSWRLKDDLDMEDFGGSWLSHPGNAEFVEKADRALFQCIQASAELRAMFLIEADDGSMVLSVKAMAIYVYPYALDVYGPHPLLHRPMLVMELKLARLSPIQLRDIDLKL
jgi:hypothetical protein